MSHLTPTRATGPADGPRQLLGRDPAALLALVQAALTLFLSFGALGWAGLTTQTDLALLLGVLNALSAVYLAWGTTETALAAVVELFKGGVAFAAIYGLSITVEQTALAIVLINAIATAFLRTQTSPLTHGSFATISPEDTATPPATATAPIHVDPAALADAITEGFNVAAGRSSRKA